MAKKNQNIATPVAAPRAVPGAPEPGALPPRAIDTDAGRAALRQSDPLRRDALSENANRVLDSLPSTKQGRYSDAVRMVCDHVNAWGIRVAKAASEGREVPTFDRDLVEHMLGFLADGRLNR